MPIDLSIIIPVKDEAPNIPALAHEVNDALAGNQLRWECLWIDDGSRDGSLEEIRRVCDCHGSHHRYLGFTRNAGQSAALWVGFRHSRGAVLATLDGDRQSDPADIPVLYQTLIDEDVHMVNGYREKRQDAMVRRLTSRIANGFRNLTTGRTVRDVGCATRVFRRQCVDEIPGFAGMHRFLPTLVAMQGFRLTERPVNHRPRLEGVSKYTIGNRLWVGLYDIVGVRWLKKRMFHYQINTPSDFYKR